MMLKKIFILPDSAGVTNKRKNVESQQRLSIQLYVTTTYSSRD